MGECPVERFRNLDAVLRFNQEMLSPFFFDLNRRQRAGFGGTGWVLHGSEVKSCRAVACCCYVVAYGAPAAILAHGQDKHSTLRAKLAENYIAL